MSKGVVRSLGSGRFLYWRALDADGAAGGLLICWDKRSLEIVDWEEGQYSLSCRFKNVEDGVVWVFTRVYGPFHQRGKRMLVGRDWGWLVDLPLQGRVFTWSGGLNNQSWARLGRFLVSPSWLDQFNGVIQRRLPCPVSDHFPLLLEGGGLRRALQQVDYWDRVESERRLSLEETELKEEAKESYKKWVLLEESHWRQLLREKWLKEGDKNTGFFHRMANAHRNNNSLDRVKIDGVWLLEEQEVREGIANAYQQMLSENLGLWPDGFTMAFWQSCWDFVKGEILEMFKEFHEQSSFLESLNNTFLVPIPKKGRAADLGDFRPIRMEVLDALIRRAVAGATSQGLLTKPLQFGMGWKRKWEETSTVETTIYIQRGRITLIRSTLASMPIYHMSLFRMPNGRQFVRIRAREARLKEASALEQSFAWDLLHALRVTNPLWRKTQSVEGRKNGKFRVKEAYRLVARSNDIVFPSDAFGWIQSNQGCILCLEATWGRVLTLDRLQKRMAGFLIVALCVVVKKKLCAVGLSRNCKGGLN
ncbi:hypothetical protein CK203_034743 [Vitis vinifera]|uniref:Uncharacterized protein n=1 Tax=Vitis vinifera TaxID=29760 RepID=A0A438HWJ8_VITVI|nr:hypothetical protein CK203_034743 [Vitis vinifera]